MKDVIKFLETNNFDYNYLPSYVSWQDDSIVISNVAFVEINKQFGQFYINNNFASYTNGGRTYRLKKVPPKMKPAPDYDIPIFKED